MLNFAPFVLALLIISVPQVTFCAVAPTAAKTTNTAAIVVAPPKSVFDDKLSGGKDPFFPNSARRVEKTPVVTPGTNAKPVAATLATQLAIKYIAPNRQFVLINDKTIGIGEEASVKISNGRARVKVLEIGDKTVSVSIEGDPEKREIKMRDTF